MPTLFAACLVEQVITLAVIAYLYLEVTRNFSGPGGFKGTSEGVLTRYFGIT